MTVFLTLHDLVTLLKRSKRAILFWTLIGGFFTSIWTLTKPIEYEAKGSFREKSKSESGISSVSAIFLQASQSEENATTTTMKSQRVMTEVIEQLNLQGSIDEVISFGKPGIYLTRIRDHLKAEWKGFWKPFLPALPTKTVPLKLKNVVYNSETPYGLKVHFLSEETYELYDPHTTTLSKHKIGEKVTGNNYQFTLLQKRNLPLKQRRYTITFLPKWLVIKSLEGKTNIKQDAKDKTLIALQHLNKTREAAAEVLNTIMASYHDYQVSEQKRIANAQLEYLSERQGVMSDKLANLLKRHATKVTNDLSSLGFPNTDKAFSFLAQQQTLYQERMIQSDLETKRLKQQTPTIGQPPDESVAFEALDLESVKGLYLTYSQNLHNLKAKTLQYAFISNELKKPDFEITSLGNLLTDPVSSEMIKKTSQLTLSLQDENNRSAKEKQRIQEEINVNKRFLFNHLKQSIELFELEQNLIQDKIGSLQGITLQLLAQEKEVLQKHQKELNISMTTLPDQWAQERLIEQQIDSNIETAKEIVKLLESKQLASNLEVIRSSPLDFAVVSINPISTKLPFYAVLGMLIGAFFSSTFFITKAGIKGIHVSEENLKEYGFKTAGTLSKKFDHTLLQPLFDSDLNTLRKIVAQVVDKTSILTVEGKGPHYALSLGKLINMTNKRVLIIDLTIQNKTNNGLLHYLNGNDIEPSLCQEQGISILYAEEPTRFISEKICSKRFASLLTTYRKNYDLIITSIGCSPLSGEVLTLLPLFDHTVLSLNDETLSEISCYQGNDKISFLLY